jgi:streptogramin lyase
MMSIQASEMTFGPDSTGDGVGELYVSGGASSNVLRYDGQTGAFLDAFVPTGSGGLSRGAGVAFGPDGNLYVASAANSAVLRYDGQTGTFLNAFVASGSGGLSNAVGLLFGPDHNLYVTSYDTGAVMRYDGQTGAPLPSAGNAGAVFVQGGSGGLRNPTGMVFGPDGNLYATGVGNTTVLKYNGSTGAFLGRFADSGGAHLHSMAIGPDGNLYVSSQDTSAVLRFDWTGALVDSYVPAGAGGLNQPTGVAFGPDHALYVNSWTQSSVYRASVSADYYKETLSAGQTVTFSTSTPGDGPGQPANRLDPHLELYNPTQALVASGTVLADGRNEAITYTVPASGTYYVKVSAQNSTEGDYVLDPVASGGAGEARLPARSSAVPWAADVDARHPVVRPDDAAAPSLRAGAGLSTIPPATALPLSSGQERLLTEVAHLLVADGVVLGTPPALPAARPAADRDSVVSQGSVLAGVHPVSSPSSAADPLGGTNKGTLVGDSAGSGWDWLRDAGSADPTPEGGLLPGASTSALPDGD